MKTKEQIKTRFKNKMIPDENDYGDLIDTCVATESVIDLTTAGWSGNNQIITISGLTSSSDVFVYPPSERTAFLAYGNAQINATSIEEGEITFTCTTTPEIDINGIIILWR